MLLSEIRRKIKYSNYYYYLDRILNYRFEKKRFLRYNGYEVDLKNPKTFNNKVVVKKLFDRNPLLPKTADKFLVKDIVSNIDGLNIIPTLFYGDNPLDIRFYDLPKDFIIKGVHYSGSNMIVREGDNVNLEKIISHCIYLLNTGIHFHSHEWLYRKIHPALIIEPLLMDKSGNIPPDYKFFAFNGKVQLIQVDRDRFGKIKRCLFDTKGNIIKGNILYPSIESEIGISNNLLNKAIKIAEKCAHKFDFVRVDLYIFSGKIYFGELTHYPGSGKSKIEPFELDYQLGSYWNLGDYFKYE